MKPLVYVERMARPLIQVYGRMRRGISLGVRGIVVNSQGEILLVEHSYVHGWHLPGGGVEPGETAHAAIARELKEEAGVALSGPAKLISVHNNDALFKGDHVLVFEACDWTSCKATGRGEIIQVRWFAPEALPDETTRGARARLAERLTGAPPDPYW